MIYSLQVICKVAKGTVDDVDYAVACAKVNKFPLCCLCNIGQGLLFCLSG